MKIVSENIRQRWQGQELAIDRNWLIDALINKIKGIDWQDAKRDVENFLRAHEREALAVWGEDFFLARVKTLGDYLPQ